MVYLCVRMSVYSSVDSPPVKNVTDLVQVLLWVVLLTLWLSLMYTYTFHYLPMVQ